MFINKIHILLITILLLLALVIANIYVIKDHYRLNNIYGAPAGSRINFVEYYFGSIKDKIVSAFIINSDKGLELQDFLIPERSQENLLSDFPLNIKDWQPAYYKYPDGSFRKINMRYRGDNPNGWAHEKKSLRIKLKKTKLIDSQRVINFTLPQDRNILGTYLSYYLGKKVGLLTPDVELIEARINGKNSGIFLKKSQIDEIFLRKNKKMPVNIYKGEQYHTGRAFESEADLFNNPSLWSKVSVFNQRSEDDFSDLARFIKLVRLAQTSNAHFDELTRIADIEEWAKFSAFQTLNQSWHNDNSHNMRMVSDLWSGSITPIVHDTNSVFTKENNDNLIFDSSPHYLYEIYNQSSKFLYLKYNFLYDFLKNKALLDAANHVEEIVPLLTNSWIRDPYHTQFSMTNGGIPYYESSVSSMNEIWKDLIIQIRLKHASLLNKLEENPKANWHYQKNIFSLVTNSLSPIGNLVLTLNEENHSKLSVYYDKDNNGIISDEDILIPSSNNGNQILLFADFVTNRNVIKNSFEDLPHIELGNTQFNLIFDNQVNIKKVEAKNSFTKNEFTIQNTNDRGNTPGRLNLPIIENTPLIEIWSGIKRISGVNIIDHPIVIKPGTLIEMEEKANIIFRNKVMINGSEELPIVIKPLSENSYWGTIALQGKQTSGSKFSNLIISGGSGYESANNKYSGMLSIHNTNNIWLENIVLEDNNFFDDVLHFVYSSNVNIVNCSVNNAFADAIDIDITTISISKCKIDNSANDGIDSMTSKVKINETLITNSGDKAVSVGENSDVLIISSNLEGNNIGVETKDNSNTKIVESTLINNVIQSNAYLKNWQYSSGGNVQILNTEIYPTINRVTNDKKSSTYFLDDKYNPEIIGEVKNTFFIGKDDLLFENNNITKSNFNSFIESWEMKLH